MLKERARNLAWKLLGQFMAKNINDEFPELYRVLLYNMNIAYLKGRTDEKEHIEYEILDDSNIYFPLYPKQ